MFNKISSSGIDFISNPPLPDEPLFVPEEKDGVISNKLTYQPKSNHSIFEDVIYNPSTMSLAAKLNAGVKLTPVGFGQLENDPSKLNDMALLLENEINSKLDSINLEPSNPE